MVDPGHGKISIGTPIYDIKIKLSHTEYERLLEFYHKYNSRQDSSMPNIEFHPWSDDAEGLIVRPTPTHRNVTEWF